MCVLLGGLVALIASAAVLLPSVLDSVNGPRLSVPGSRTVELEEGTWVLFELTGRSRGSGGVTFNVDEGVSIRPHHVTVSGPRPVTPRSDLGGATQTITRGRLTYTGAVRFDIAAAGTYEIAVDHARQGEVIVARPVSEIFSDWPWFVLGFVGSVGVVAGAVMWLVGAAHRRQARRESS